MREAWRTGDTGDDIVQSYAREDRHPVPRRLAVERDLIPAARELISDQIGECMVGKLRLLETHHVGLALIEPWEQPRQALLDRVDVPGGDPHAKWCETGH